MCAQLRTAQVGGALRCLSPGFLFSLFDSVRTRRLIFIEIELNSIYDGAFRFCLDTPLLDTKLTFLSVHVVDVINVVLVSFLESLQS